MMQVAEGIALAVMTVVCCWIGFAQTPREEIEPVIDQPAPMTPDRMKRLQEIADVPILDIITAAERRATHPDEPLPRILSDLDPETREQDTTPAEAPVVAARVNINPSLDGFLSRLKAEVGKTVVLPPGMDYKVIPAPYEPRPKRQPVRDPYANCNHSEADRAEICSWGSPGPVKTIVTGCPRCDRRPLVAGYVDESAPPQAWPNHWQTQFHSTP